MSTAEVETKPFELPMLPYPEDALEEFIDAQTMNLHYNKHHQGYVKKLNNAISGSELEEKALDEILRNISQYSTAVRNNGGGHFNHSLFWTVMSPEGGGEPGAELKEVIEKDFGSFQKFQEQFELMATSQFGSGWAWLVVDDGKLKVGSTPNQDNPLMDITEIEGTPILALDVWEHAYYLKYQNRRPDYVRNFWKVVNWEEVNRRYQLTQ